MADIGNLKKKWKELILGDAHKQCDKMDKIVDKNFELLQGKKGAKQHLFK